MSMIVPRHRSEVYGADQVIGPDGEVWTWADLWPQCTSEIIPVVVPGMGDAIVNVVTAFPGGYPSPPPVSESPGAALRQPHELLGRPRGVWVVAGTGDGKYPCRCMEDGRECRPMWCPCAGRVDLDELPQACCARRFTPADVARASKEYEDYKRRQSS